MIIVVAVTLFPVMQMANFASGTGNLQNSTGNIEFLLGRVYRTIFIFSVQLLPYIVLPEIGELSSTSKRTLFA